MILQILALLISVGTFLPLIRNDSWVVRGWDFPRMQLFALGLLTLIGLSIFSFNDGELVRDWFVLGFLVLALITLALLIWRYTSWHKKEVKDGDDGDHISFIVSNVLMKNRTSDKLISLVRERKPDVFVSLETDKWWAKRLSVLKDEYPYTVEVPQEDTYGMLFYSKLPLEGEEVEYIIRKDIPSIHARVKIGGKHEVQLHALHPKPPFPDEDTSSTDRDAELLLVGQRVEERGGATIVLGDMNDVAWSWTTRLFQKTSRLLDPRVGRGLFSTFHAGHWFLRWPLDHIFISDHFRVVDLERLPNVGSDHFPIYAKFSYQPEGQNSQEAPEKEEGDDEQAEEKIAAAVERKRNS